MDDQLAKENPVLDFNKLDLSQLQGFSFGKQWAQDKTAARDSLRGTARPSAPRENREGADRRDGPRDHQAFRKPAPGPSATGAGAGPSRRGGRRSVRTAAIMPATGARLAIAGRGNYQADDRRDGPGGGRYGGRHEQIERGPYESPYFAVTFYPEDTSFNALAKTIRSSCRTIELPEIARTVIDKLDRFVVVLTRKSSSADAFCRRRARRRG